MTDQPQFRLVDAEPTNPAMRVAIALVSSHDDEVRCIGSAFLVAPGLAITASHVVEEWAAYQEPRGGSNKHQSNFSATGFQLIDGKAYDWSIESIYGLRTADLAFLQLRRPAWWGDGPGQIVLPIPRINLNPPEIGQTIRVFGFPDSRIENGILVISPCECSARVAGVSLKGSLRIRPTAYVELHGEIAAGMSGGPCFDSDGNFIGMASKGWDFLEDGPESTPLSYMALLWPAMSVPIDLYKTGKFPVWEVFKAGGRQALGHRRVHVSTDGRVNFARNDPDALVAHPSIAPLTHLEASVRFASENARRAIVELRELSQAGANDSTLLDPNLLHRALRTVFWELSAVQGLSLNVAATRRGFVLGRPATWEQFAKNWREHDPNPVAFDTVAPSAFAWHSPELFDVRTYAENLTSNVLSVQSLMVEGKTIASLLDPCRVGGHQIMIPDGLEAYFSKTLDFSQRLLRAVERASAATA